jgi:hypothetical protein
LWTPQYRVAIDGSRAAFVGMLGSLDATLDEKQRGRAKRELLALADEIQGLTGGRG